MAITKGDGSVMDLADMLGIKINALPWDGADRLPYVLAEAYDFRKATLDGISCVFAEPQGEMPPIQALLRNIERMREVEQLPIVLKLSGLSAGRRRALIEARIPFVAEGQAYLPFLGVVLNERLYGEPKPREKLMPSAQLVLFSYLYQGSPNIYTNGLDKKLGMSAMQITRAVRQLQRLRLFEVSKEGVKVVISGKANHRALFESAAEYILDPVREIVYMPRGSCEESMPASGLSALSGVSMLAAPAVATYAYYSRTDRLHGESVLIDREKQARVEIWKYPPAILSGSSDTADTLSVIASLRDEHDERVEQAIEQTLEKIWR
jgi:hypothetical protein